MPITSCGTRLRVAPSPSRMGSGGEPRRGCIILFLMNLDDLIGPAIEFFSHGIGAILADVAKFIYALLYPANAEAATPVVIPE